MPARSARTSSTAPRSASGPLVPAAVAASICSITALPTTTASAQPGAEPTDAGTHPAPAPSGQDGCDGAALATPEIKATPGAGLELLAPSGTLRFATAECPTPTDLCELSRQLQAVLAKFIGDE